MSLSLFPEMPTTRKAGRPPTIERAGGETKLFAVAHARMLGGRTAAQVADAYGVTPRTVKRWTKAALDADGPDGDALRRMVCARDEYKERQKKRRADA